MALCKIASDHVWKPGRGGKFDHCVKCKTRFPCPYECVHLDCKLTRSGRGHELGFDLPGWPLTATDPTQLEGDD